jgi:type I restriction enzyme S subunit
MVVPEDWESRPIGDFLEFKNGLNKGKEYFGHGTPIVNYMDVYHHRGLHRKEIQGRVSLDANEIRRFGVKKNDVFFTRTSETPDEVGISSVLLDELPDGVFSGFVLRGRPKSDELLPNYCKYCFSTEEVREEIIRTCTYTTRALTNGNVLSRIHVLVPSEDEQQRIAEALNDVDNLIESMEKLIAKKRDLRERLAQELLTGARRLPGFDGPWRQVNLQDALELCTETIPVSDIDETTYVGTENMLKDKGGVASFDKHVTYANVREYLPGDILFSNIRPYLKKIWFADRSGGCSNDVLVLRSVDANLYDSHYCYLVLSRDDFFAFVTNNSSGTKMPRGDKEAVKTYQIAMPEGIGEQRAVSQVLTDVDDDIIETERKLSKYKQVRQGMMRELLTGRIRLAQE